MPSETTIYILALAAVFLLVILGVAAIRAHTELTEQKRILDSQDPGKIVESAIGGFFKGFGL